MDLEANFTDNIFYDATDGADNEMDIWKEIVCDNFSSMTPNENEDNENEDDGMNIDWSDITFDDLDESSSTMPNENERADNEMDIDWENAAFDNSGFSA